MKHVQLPISNKQNIIINYTSNHPHPQYECYCCQVMTHGMGISTVTHQQCEKYNLNQKAVLKHKKTCCFESYVKLIIHKVQIKKI